MDMYGQASSVSTWTTEKRREGPLTRDGGLGRARGTTCPSPMMPALLVALRSAG